MSLLCHPTPFAWHMVSPPRPPAALLLIQKSAQPSFTVSFLQPIMRHVSARTYKQLKKLAHQLFAQASAIYHRTSHTQQYCGAQPCEGETQNHSRIWGILRKFYWRASAIPSCMPSDCPRHPSHPTSLVESKTSFKLSWRIDTKNQRGGWSNTQYNNSRVKYNIIDYSHRMGTHRRDPGRALKRRRVKYT